MDYCFDTSAINRLNDDPDQKAIVAGLLAANRVLITAVNVIETVVTEDPARRLSLLRLQQQLAKENRQLRIPPELLREMTMAYARNLSSVTLTIVEETGAGVWWALHEPETVTEEARQEGYVWKKKLEDGFTGANRLARPEMQKLFGTGDRPKSIGKLIQLLCKNPLSFISTMSRSYQSITGKPLSIEEMRELFVAVPEWPLYLAGWAQGMYARALQDRGYSPRNNPGTIDLWFAIYLGHCDFLVTNDVGQYKALRVINVLSNRRTPKTRILLYNQFRRRLVLSTPTN
jgi:hypothetical protein